MLKIDLANDLIKNLFGTVQLSSDHHFPNVETYIPTCRSGSLVTEGSKVVGSPPLVLEALFMAQVLQSAQNEARPLLWRDQKPCLHCQRRLKSF